MQTKLVFLSAAKARFIDLERITGRRPEIIQGTLSNFYSVQYLRP